MSMVGAWVTTRRPFFRPQWMLAGRRRAWRSLHERDSRGFHFIVPPGDRFYADPFPTEWQFERVLLEQPAVDPTLWEHDETFWLFANLSPAGTELPCQD